MRGVEAQRGAQAGPQYDLASGNRLLAEGALADSALGEGRLKVIVLIGDGGATIGISHLIHAALVNADVTVLVHNNCLSGMTGGQGSALTPRRFVTTTTPAGSFTPPRGAARRRWLLTV